MNETEIDKLMATHYTWLVSMGYMKTERPLELLALVTSEIGEAINAYRDHGVQSDQFATELADIVLRTLGIAQHFQIDLVSAINTKIIHNYTVLQRDRNRGRTI
jgi:NTP pyrophosphatase (non-canonical NTP hydrolase)